MGSNKGERILCSAERFVRGKASPLLGDLDYNARMRRGRLTLGHGLFCKTHQTPGPPGRTVMDKFLRRGGHGSVTRFSAATGELEVVDSEWKVLW